MPLATKNRSMLNDPTSRKRPIVQGGAVPAVSGTSAEVGTARTCRSLVSLGRVHSSSARPIEEHPASSREPKQSTCETDKCTRNERSSERWQGGE
eukprot:9240763-Pyramimonas_sp.AAC.1